MTDKELQKLRRADLIEILYCLSRENDELKAENEQLKARLDAILAGAVKQPADLPAPPDKPKKKRK